MGVIRGHSCDSQDSGRTAYHRHHHPGDDCSLVNRTRREQCIEKMGALSVQGSQARSSSSFEYRRHRSESSRSDRRRKMRSRRPDLSSRMYSSEIRLHSVEAHRCAAVSSRSPSNRQSSPQRLRRPRRVLFLMGLPGSGKSTIKRRRLSPGDNDIEPDQLKRRHRRFRDNMDEQTDEEVHRWSVRRALDVFEDAVRDRRHRDIVFDSSGSNASWLRRRIETARRKGFTTELLWIDVPVEIALLRNRDRGFERDRRGQFCPEKIILDKALLMEASYQELSRCVDSAERLQNWSERDGELERAREDIYLYPAPRSRPPALRWGMDDYGQGPDGARSPSPSHGSRRTMRIGPWKRNDEVTKRKNARLAWMDRSFKGDRENFVSKYVLGSREVLLERNRFPYHLPPGAEHWTIWARKPMNHDELCAYVEGWLDAREPHHVVSWNYDDNRGRRTIDIWHVHIYFQGKGGQPPILTCPSSLKRSIKQEEKESDKKRRRTRGASTFSTATTKAPSSMPSQSARRSIGRSLCSEV